MKVLVEEKSLGNFEMSENITFQAGDIPPVFVFPHPFVDTEVSAQVKHH